MLMALFCFVQMYALREIRPFPLDVVTLAWDVVAICVVSFGSGFLVHYLVEVPAKAWLLAPKAGASAIESDGNEDGEKQEMEGDHQDEDEEDQDDEEEDDVVPFTPPRRRVRGGKKAVPATAPVGMSARALRYRARTAAKEAVQGE